jgi:hypothetical protein
VEFTTPSPERANSSVNSERYNENTAVHSSPEPNALQSSLFRQCSPDRSDPFMGSLQEDRITIDAIHSLPKQSVRMLLPNYSDQEEELELDTELEVVEEEPKVHLFDCLLDDQPLGEGHPRTREMIMANHIANYDQEGEQCDQVDLDNVLFDENFGLLEEEDQTLVNEALDLFPVE